MSLLFRSTEDFERDLQSFDAAAQQRISERVNHVAQTFVADKRAFARQVGKPASVTLSNGYDSSLYSVKVEPDVHVVLTVDDDPLFDQVIVTLLRVVRRADLQEAYEATAQALYRDLNGARPKQEVGVG